MSMFDVGVRRLNVGCGPCIAPGWTNADRLTLDAADISCDIRTGLPVESDRFDYIVGIHLLQDFAYGEIPAVLRELRRVLKPGGVLRLGLPDLGKAMAAYLRGDAGYFYIPDEDAASIGCKLVTQLVWYGSVRTPFTFDCIGEWLMKGGFRNVVECRFKETQSIYPEIVELDNRERESLFVEATK